MATTLLVIGVLMLSAALVLTFMPLTSSMIFALFGVWAMNRSGYLHVSSSQLMFWLTFTIILLVISRIRGDKAILTANMRRFMAIGGIAGTVVAVAVGATVNTVALGPLAGSAAGALFFFRSRRVAIDRGTFQAVAPALLPMVVTYTLMGITLIGILQ
ncbi:MAG: hypothetical protein K2M07_05205 [Muribaculaceae bacterium]|nr:hypothetical protein [Muribaculaceae bacterium]